MKSNGNVVLTAVIKVIIQCNNGTNRSYYSNGVYKSRRMYKTRPTSDDTLLKVADDAVRERDCVNTQGLVKTIVQ